MIFFGQNWEIVESSCNRTSVLVLLLAYCYQSLPYFQWDVKCLNAYKFGPWNGV